MIGQMTLIFYSTLVWFYRSNLRCATLGRKTNNLGVVLTCLITTLFIARTDNFTFITLLSYILYCVEFDFIPLDQIQCIYSLYTIFTSKVW